LSVLTGVLLTAAAAGCDGGAAEPAPAPIASAVSAPPTVDARAALAAVAALAEDRRYAAVYTLDTVGRPQRQVVATAAADGSWRVDIPGGALGGTADVSIVQIDAGVFQCSLPSATNPAAPTCVKVADPDERVPARYDPEVQRVLHDWLAVFTDRTAGLSVSVTTPLEGVQGTCYAVESISAALRAPFDVGIYCYAPDGLPTGARVAFGELRLAGAPAAAPPSVDLPGAVVGGDPMGMASPSPGPVDEDTGEPTGAPTGGAPSSPATP
jgi:hypothetical protein